MRIGQKQQRNRQRSKFLFWLLPVIFATLFFNMEQTDAKAGITPDRMMPYSPNLDSLTLIYNDIDASAFPWIVSLVTVTNDAGFVVGKLDTSHFKVHEDSVREYPITVEELTADEIGINVILAIDRSGSMRGQPIDDAKTAAGIFVELMQEKDKSAIVSFAHTIRTDYPFSNDKDSLAAAISRIQATGGTAIYDAVIHSVYLMTYDLKNRAIILLTDGADKDSQYSLEEALNACVSHEIRVFTIGLGLNHNSPEENNLKELASVTGGNYYYSPSSTDLEEIYRAISKLLHHRYRVSYTTHNPAKDGTLRHVQITVNVNTNTSSDTANYRAPYDPPPDDPPPDDPPPDDPPPDDPPPDDPPPDDPPPDDPPPDDPPPDDPPPDDPPPDDPPPDDPPPDDPPPDDPPPDDPPPDDPPPDDPPPEDPPPPPAPPEEFEVIPNPFTPNDDGFNDRVEFRKGEALPPNWVILILDRSGRMVNKLHDGARFWNGKDENGQLMLPGSYLYLVSENGKILHRGLVQLIR